MHVQCPSVVELDLKFQEITFRPGTHTHTHTHHHSILCYTMSVTHPTTRTQDISACRPVRARVYRSSAQAIICFC